MFTLVPFLSVALLALHVDASRKLMDGPFAVEIVRENDKNLGFNRIQSEKEVRFTRRFHSLSETSFSTWTLSFDDENSLTFSSTEEGGLKVTGKGLKILACDGVESPDHGDPCILRSFINTPFLSPYYGYVKTRNIVEGGPMRQKKAPISYFLLFDLHLLRVADAGVPASTPSVESEAVKALHRAINQTMDHAKDVWLGLTPDKTHSTVDSAIRALAKCAAEKSTLTELMDAYIENGRQLQSELGAENLRVKGFQRNLRGDDDLRANEALRAAESRMEALSEKLSHSDRKYEQARQQLQTARVAYESASSSLQSLFSDTLSAIFAARFWAQLAVLRKAKYAVVVVNDDNVEVKFGQDEVLKLGEVEFSRESRSGCINVVGPYTDQIKLENGSSTNLILNQPRTSRSSPPYYPRRDGILSALPFGGWVELRHIAPLAPSTTSFLVFTLGDDCRILETALREVLRIFAANRAIRSALSHTAEALSSDHLDFRGEPSKLKLPIIKKKGFYRKLGERHSNIIVGTLLKSEPGQFQALDIENPFEQTDGGPLWALRSPSGKNLQLRFENDTTFRGNLLNGFTGYPLEKMLSRLALRTAQDGQHFIKTNSEMLLPDSPLLGAWRVCDQSSFEPSRFDSIRIQPTIAIHPKSTVLVILDPERVDGNSLFVQKAIKSAFHHLPSHYGNPFASPDMQRPIYEVFAFWYQVEMIRLERGSETMSSQSLSASASAESIPQDPFFAALVVLNYQIICLKVGAPGTDIVISKEWLSEAEDLIIRYIESADKGQVRVDLTGQRAETLDAQFGKITVSDSILIYVVGGVNTEEVAVRVAAVVDMVVLGIPFDDSLMYRRLAENSSSPPQLVFIGEDGVPVYPSVHEPYRVDSPAGSLQLVRDTILVNGESIEPFTMFCRIPLTSANCVKQKNSNFPVVLYDVNGVGPIDINLTLKELDKAHKKGMS